MKWRKIERKAILPTCAYAKLRKEVKESRKQVNPTQEGLKNYSQDDGGGVGWWLAPLAPIWPDQRSISACSALVSGECS